MTSVVVILGLGLQVWALFNVWPSRRHPLAIAIAVATCALAIRGVAALVLDNPAGLPDEILLVVVSATLLFSATRLQVPNAENSVNALALMDRSPSPIMVKKTSGEYLYLNNAFEDNFGKIRADLLGKKSEEIWPLSIREEGGKSDRILLATRQSTSHILNFSRSNGDAKYWLVNKFLLPLPDGEEGIVTVYADISEKQEYERRLAESEERYGLASRHAGIWDWNALDDRMYISPAFAQLVGWNEEQAKSITSKEVDALYHPADYLKHRKILAEHIADPSKSYDSEFRLRMPDGNYRWFRTAGQCIKDERGKILRMAGMITDIHEERRAAEALKISEAQISTLLDNSPAPIYFKDKNLRFVMINQRYTDVYNVTLEDVVGRTSSEVFPESWGQAFKAHDKEVLKSRSLIVREEKINDATFLTAKFPVIDQDGNLLGIGGIETDISARVSVEMAYRQARDDAEAANRSKSAFLANMSHELRTPLNSVIGFSDSLLAGTLGDVENPLHREYLSIIRTAGEHLLDLINDILDLSRIEAGKLELEETHFDIADVIVDAVRLTAERAGSNGLLVAKHITPDLPKLYADERQIKQVIINLLSNSIKFTEPGGQITVSAALSKNGKLEISVSDNGSGISAEDLERVQKPFIQVADAMTRKHTGSGLGLSIVRSIIKMHGGSTHLDSKLGEGTTVTITLPKNRLQKHQEA